MFFVLCAFQFRFDRANNFHGKETTNAKSEEFQMSWHPFLVGCTQTTLLNTNGLNQQKVFRRNFSWFEKPPKDAFLFGEDLNVRLYPSCKQRRTHLSFLNWIAEVSLLWFWQQKPLLHISFFPFYSTIQSGFNHDSFVLLLLITCLPSYQMLIVLLYFLILCQALVKKSTGALFDILCSTWIRQDFECLKQSNNFLFVQKKTTENGFLFWVMSPFVGHFYSYVTYQFLDSVKLLFLNQ